MKLFIAVDLEGVTGVVHTDQLMPEGRGYAAAQKLLTADVNAVIEGVLASYPDAEIVVGDGHGPMRNVILTELHPRAELVVGGARVVNKPLCQLQGIDTTFDAAMMVGYHSKSGTPGGLLAHTYVGSLVREWRLNGHPVGEITMNTAVFGAFDVPVLLISGNSCLKPEIDALSEKISFVCTKKTLGPTAAICKTPATVHAELTKAAADAIKQTGYKAPAGPTTIDIVTYRREQAEKAATAAGVVRTDEFTLNITASNAAEAFQIAWQACATALEETPVWLQ